MTTYIICNFLSSSIEMVFPQTGKKFAYAEPPRRVREVLEEELYFQRDECRIRHPSEVALERIWSLKRNFPVGGFNPASQNQSCFLSQPYYSRHAVIRSKNVVSPFFPAPQKQTCALKTTEHSSH
uniref:Chromosome 11 open reading frame 97 n=1 Tax=Laticauda laticaudata TaxID=8630 RepID=A0A8C5S9T4_LATLA